VILAGDKELSNQNRVGDLKEPTKSRLKRRSRAGAHRYRSRLADPATRRQEWKRPNALKHGAFSVNPAIPSENPREFQELYSALIDEWNPSGPTEEDRVFGIADAMWRKLRSQKFARAKVVANSLDPKHPAFDEGRGLVTFGIFMCSEPETAFGKYASKCLRADKIDYLKQKFPRQNFEAAADWAMAVSEEIRSVLLPETPGFLALEPEEKLDHETAAVRTGIIEAHSFVTTIHASEFLEHDLNQRERLDARISRLTKELIEIKTMKQMLRRTSTDE
jgi:hypothetical protein